MSTTQNLTLVQAVRDGLKCELERDDDVVVFGEDVGENGGVFRATQGLHEEFGAERVFDTPLAESGIVGTAVGMAAYGMVPVPEIQFSGFMYPGFDQIVSHAARMRTRSRGRFTVPMTLRAPYGGGIRAPEHHSESKEAFYTHEAGLKVAVPSTPHDTKGLLAAAIRDPDPVVFLEPKLIYRAFREEVPEEPYTVPLGDADVKREGEDLTVVAIGELVPVALELAERYAGEVDIEVVDPRSLLPLDEETIFESVRKTGHVVVADDTARTCGAAAEIASRVSNECFWYLDAPVKRVTRADVPVSYSPPQEEYVMPDEETLERAVTDIAA